MKSYLWNAIITCFIGFFVIAFWVICDMFGRGLL